MSYTSGANDIETCKDDLQPWKLNPPNTSNQLSMSLTLAQGIARRRPQVPHHGRIKMLSEKW